MFSKNVSSCLPVPVFVATAMVLHWCGAAFGFQALASSISSSSLWRGTRRWRCSLRKTCTARSAVWRSRGRLISSRPTRRCSLRDASYSCRASWSPSWNLCTESGQSTGSASDRGTSTAFTNSECENWTEPSSVLSVTQNRVWWRDRRRTGSAAHRWSPIVWNIDVETVPVSSTPGLCPPAACS